MKDPLLYRASQLLDELEQTSGKPGDLSSALQRILQTAQNTFQSDGSIIFALNPFTGLFMEAATWVEDEQIRTVHLEQLQPRELTQEVLKHGIVLGEDLGNMPEAYQNFFARSKGFRALVGMALREKYHQRTLGTLYVNFLQPQHFSSSDKQFFQFFADQTSYILQETWLLQRYREVARIGQEINQELSTVDALFQKLLEHVDSILDVSYIFQLAVYQMHTNTFDIYVREQGQTAVIENQPLEEVDRSSIEEEATIFVTDLSKEKEHVPFQFSSSQSQKRQGSLIFVPLILRNHFLGALSIQHSQLYVYNQEDLFILELLANHIALALYNIHLYDSLTLLNETGQILTQQLESEQAIQAIVEQICQATQADNVILYPYESAARRFILPPRVSGKLQDLTPLRTKMLRPYDIAVRALEHDQAIFSNESASLYTILRGALQVEEINFQEREQIRSTAVIPLRVGKVAVGVLFVNYRQPQQFHTPQKFLIEGLGHYAAIALKNAQAFNSVMQRRIRELEIFQEIDRELSLTVQLHDVLETILRLAYEHVTSEEASILLYNSDLHMLEPRATISRHPEISMAKSIPLDEARGITAWVVTNKTSALVNNIYEKPWSDRYIQVSEDICSELDVPLIYDNEVIGVLNFESTQQGAFNHDEELFMTALAGQVVLAINKSQAYEREKRLAEEGRVLNEISREINSQLDLNDVLDLILEKALALTSSSTGTLLLYRNNMLSLVAERGVTQEKKHEGPTRLDQGIVGHVAAHKVLLNIDPLKPDWADIFLDYIPGTRSELVVPILAGVELLGVLNVESNVPHHFRENDERLLTSLADMAGVAIQNARAYQQARRLADESQVLYDVSREIASQFDSSNVFDLILQKALELTGALNGSIYLYRQDIQNLHRVAECDMQGEASEGKRYQYMHEGVVGYTATHKSPCNIEDITQPPWHTIFIKRASGVRSELAVPMLEGADLRGVINVESREVAHFKESDVRLLQGLAALAVVAQQNSERYQKAEREAQQFKLLYRAGQELNRIVEWEQLELAYDCVLQIAEEHSQCYVALHHYNDTRNVLTLARATHYAWEERLHITELHDGPNGQVARERASRVIEDTRQPPAGIEISGVDPSLRSLLTTPIEFKDRYYGTLTVGHEAIGHFHGTDIHFFDGLAGQLASTMYRLETIKARQELEQMSSIGQSAFEVTHRLDNDLGLISLYVITNQMIHGRLNDIMQSAEAVLSFSRDLKKEFAKLGDKDDPGEPVVLIPQTLLHDAVSSAAVPAHILVDIQGEDSAVPIRATHSQVADILLNLVSNAIQAMPAGGKLTLRALNAGHFVALEVADTGTGIPLHKQKQIFELFFSTKGSSGFGLWSARRNALKNRGDLRVRNARGVGTIFTLLLPRAVEETV
jgi:GAF domain-containing protein